MISERVVGSDLFGLTLLQATNTVEPIDAWNGPTPFMETADVTKKEIVKKISEDIGLTQLKTKDIVQRTLDAIIHTLVSEGRIELRNFGVFEVKRRAPRKARNPRTGDKVFVPEKFVVTFKPGKEMEERVKELERQAAAAARTARSKPGGKDASEPIEAAAGYGSGEPGS